MHGNRNRTFLQRHALGVPTHMYIQKQANGTYRVWVRRRGRSTSSTFDRKADAEAFGRRIEAAIEAGASVEYQKIKSATLADLLRLYETNVIPDRRRQHGRAT